jgi:hypothetical protein
MFHLINTFIFLLFLSFSAIPDRRCVVRILFERRNAEERYCGYDARRASIDFRESSTIGCRELRRFGLSTRGRGRGRGRFLDEAKDSVNEDVVHVHVPNSNVSVSSGTSETAISCTDSNSS